MTATRQILIDRALELLTKSSCGSVSVDDICAAANVKKGSFYHFFPSKMALVVAALQAASCASQNQYEEIFSAESSAIVRFERFADSICETQLRVAEQFGCVCGCPVVTIACELAGQDNDVTAVCNDLMRSQEHQLELALADLVGEELMPPTTDLKAKAHELNVYVLGLLMLARIRNDLTFLKRELRSGILLLLSSNATLT